MFSTHASMEEFCFTFFISRLHLHFASTSDSILIEKFFTYWNVRPFFPLCSNHINFRFVIQILRNLCLKILKVEISIKLVLPWVLALCTCAHLQKSFKINSSILKKLYQNLKNKGVYSTRFNYYFSNWMALVSMQQANTGMKMKNII